LTLLVNNDIFFWRGEIMMTKAVKISVLMSVLLFLFSAFVYAEQGTTAASFLKLDQGIRPVSLGGAFTAAADDVNAIMYNPSGLSQLKGIEITSMYSIWFAGIFYGYLAGAFNAGEIGTFGIGVVYVGVNDIPRWDALGQPGAAFGAYDLGVNLAYGTAINKELSLGITLKAFNESIDDSGAFGFAADLGAIYKLPIKDFQLGMTIVNLGPKFGFGEAFWLPIAFKFGASYKGIRNMMLNMDYIQPIETYGILAMGMEYWYRDLLVMRLGFQFQGKFDLQEWYENFAGPDIMGSLVLGAGIKIDIYEIDYAYRQFGVLESTHRIGLTLKFK
jgi:hypothetical protein